MTDSQRTAWVWQMTILVLQNANENGEQNEPEKSISESCGSNVSKCSA